MSKVPQHSNVLVVAPQASDRNLIVDQILVSLPKWYINCIQFTRDDSQDRVESLRDFVEANQSESKTVVFNDVLNRRVLRDTGLLFAPGAHLANVIVSVFDFPILYPTEKNAFTQDSTIFIRTTDERWAEIFKFYFKKSFEWIDKKYCEAAQTYCKEHEHGYIVLRFSSAQQNPEIYCFDALSANLSSESFLSSVWRWLTWQ